MKLHVQPCEVPGQHVLVLMAELHAESVQLDAVFQSLRRKNAVAVATDTDGHRRISVRLADK